MLRVGAESTVFRCRWSHYRRQADNQTRGMVKQHRVLALLDDHHGQVAIVGN